MKQLPKYFIIKAVEGYPLWHKYISWLNEKYGQSWEGDVFNYYGVEGSDSGGSGWKGTNACDSPKNFMNNPTVITLEEWDIAVNGFKLPKNWYITVNTSEQRNVYKKYFNTRCSESRGWLFNISFVYGHNGKEYTNGSKAGVEITFDEFNKHVKMEKTFKVTRKDMHTIYEIACSTWKRKVSNLVKEYFEEFDNTAELPLKLVTEMFDAASSSQQKILERVFPDYKKDLNAFISKNSETVNELLETASEEIFGAKCVIQIAEGAAHNISRKDLYGRSFYIYGDYSVKTHPVPGSGTVIEILKR